ncbi:MAG: DUF4178 domain-containing protein, partial [Bacteroidia bacterium]|nr:DUF4178 domain-containing protein [Bacteroidia bacterium]
GTISDAKSEAHQALTQPTEVPKPFSDILCVGLKGKWDGKECRIIGRTRIHSTYREYWEETEDGETEKGYEDGEFSYDEYQVVNEDGYFFYLIVDQNEYYSISESFTPIYPQNVVLYDFGNIKYLNAENITHVIEYGCNEIIFFEGEATYQVIQGEKSDFSMYQDGSYEYIIEAKIWNNKPQNEPSHYEEIEFYRERKLRRYDILEAFSSDERVKDVFRFEKDSSYVFNWLLLGSVFSFLLWIHSCTGIGEDVIYSKTFPLSQLKDSIGTHYGFWKAVPGTHRIEILGTLDQDNSDYAVGAEIINADSLTVNIIEDEFWRESGVDCDEDGCSNYSESELCEDKIFQVKESQDLACKIYAENPFNLSGTVSVNVYTGTILSRWYFLGIFLFLFLMFFTTPLTKLFFGGIKRPNPVK